MEKPFAITLDAGSSLANKTGTWRTQRPCMCDRLPPCDHACPAGENMQDGSTGPSRADYKAAWRALVENNPLPAVMGRVCYHPCETACNRGQLDEAVSINAVERFLGDEAIRQGWQLFVSAAPTGKQILIVGAGPSGLSAAYHLARLGHAVTHLRRGAAAGGMMRFGIPKYRLPRDVLDAEIGRILDMGVTRHVQSKVDDVRRHDGRGRIRCRVSRRSARISPNAHISPRAMLVAILDALAVLRGAWRGRGSEARPPVVVYGGGNTATRRRPARRSGWVPAEAIIVYRRTREQMPAHDFEVEEALEEGVTDQMALHHRSTPMVAVLQWNK